MKNNKKNSLYETGVKLQESGYRLIKMALMLLIAAGIIAIVL